MRRLLPAFAVGIIALECVSAAVTAQVVPHPAPVVPSSLKTVPVPLPEQLGDFVVDKSAAIALGKALFWDLQVGGDGQTACASCHFQAGADTRIVNQLNPGANGAFDVGGPNHTYAASEFPFHQLTNPDDRNSALVRSKDDVSGSHGVHNSAFVDIVPGSAQDNITVVPDPRFQVGGLNTRRVTGRNTPSAINAVFNVRNFWDGRANRRFNGRNPFGDSDPSARVLRVNDLGELALVHLSINNASLSSQAVGPPNNNTEMSAAGRDWLKLGKKMLSLQPLATQRVDQNDSVLGAMAITGGKGLNATYSDMIKKAFAPKWWNSKLIVDASLNVVGGGQQSEGHKPPTPKPLPTNQFTVMEANFSMFWGLAINLYESTLVSDNAPFDQFAEGNTSALTAQQQFGLKVFMGSNTGNCIACHSGSEFTGASFSARLDPVTKDGLIERMVVGNGGVAVYDGGFYNIGVRPTAEDVGVGGFDPFGNPLSIARREQLQLGSVPDAELFPPLDPTERVAVDGAFKTPTLRNVELNGPYFHNGSIASLKDVIQFYTRGGNFHDQNIANLDADIHRVKGLIGHPNRQAALADFLRGLTDERVRWNKAPFDHPELIVQNGAPGSELSVLADLTVPGQAANATFTLPATGSGGAAAPVQPFLNLPVFDSTPVPAPNPVFSGLALFATDTLTVATEVNLLGDLWSNGQIRVTGVSNARRLDGDLTAGGDIIVAGDSTVIAGSVMAHGNATLSPGVTLENGVAGGSVEFFAPLVMPALPSVTAGSSNLQVAQGTTLRQAPGRFGNVLVKGGATLILSDGQYTFKALTLQKGARLVYDENGAPDQLTASGEMPIQPTEKTTLDITSDLSISTGATISSGDASRSTHLKIYVHGSNKTIQIGSGSVFHGSLIAPNVRVALGSQVSVQGAIFAKEVSVGAGCTISSHQLPDDSLPSSMTSGPMAAMSPQPAAGNGSFINTSASDLGLEFALHQNQPNPFRPSTLIRFSLPTQRDVRLEVFDISGRMVKTLARGTFSPGLHTLQWDGSGDGGTRLHAGVYLYRLMAGKDVAKRKMILVD
jgi:cytochrome c peroxidase/cytoskeletal protein CcmA (bactofilin family)